MGQDIDAGDSFTLDAETLVNNTIFKLDIKERITDFGGFKKTLDGTSIDWAISADPSTRDTITAMASMFFQ